jgi:hypothetical protein
MSDNKFGRDTDEDVDRTEVERQLGTPPGTEDANGEQQQQQQGVPADRSREAPATVDKHPTRRGGEVIDRDRDPARDGAEQQS